MIPGMILLTDQLLLRVYIANNIISTSSVSIPVPVSIPVEIRQTYLFNVCVQACGSYETLPNGYSAAHGNDWFVTNLSLK